MPYHTKCLMIVTPEVIFITRSGLAHRYSYNALEITRICITV